MEYDPRAPYGHEHGRPAEPPMAPPQRPQVQLTFGQVFWACLLALMVFGVFNYLMVQALLEQQSSGF